MATMTFYHQQRGDGGFPTGFEIDDGTQLEMFEPGADESNPALLWHIDVECSCAGVPDNPPSAEAWVGSSGPHRPFAKWPTTSEPASISMTGPFDD
jgi:hypothetical protein